MLTSAFYMADLTCSCLYFWKLKPLKKGDLFAQIPSRVPLQEQSMNFTLNQTPGFLNLYQIDTQPYLTQPFLFDILEKTQGPKIQNSREKLKGKTQ